MSYLTEDQKRVLNYVDCFNPADPNNIRADLRHAFWELEKLGMIEPITQYHLTDAGRATLPPSVRETP